MKPARDTARAFLWRVREDVACGEACENLPGLRRYGDARPFQILFLRETAPRRSKAVPPQRSPLGCRCRELAASALQGHGTGRRRDRTPQVLARHQRLAVVGVAPGRPAAGRGLSGLAALRPAPPGPDPIRSFGTGRGGIRFHSSRCGPRAFSQYPRPPGLGPVRAAVSDAPWRRPRGERLRSRSHRQRAAGRVTPVGSGSGCMVATPTRPRSRASSGSSARSPTGSAVFP